MTKHKMDSIETELNRIIIEMNQTLDYADYFHFSEGTIPCLVKALRRAIAGLVQFANPPQSSIRNHANAALNEVTEILLTGKSSKEPRP